ncbi:TonB-dependent receptor [Pedobacter endophyticus]|uniref:TonB-dependent receptor n=2 Tax=Pedobacter endophyticus TaxID=2789740 RepID=A0A7S9L3F0_9SPHI|nr:TonB-dependent receptor [Pedobacter endophyticus]
MLLVLAGLSNANAQKKNIITETFRVNGECIQCQNRIESALRSFGTDKASWSIETKMLTVSYDSTKLSKAKIEKRLADVGHDTEDFKADAKTYESLPSCCHYYRNNMPVSTGLTPNSSREQGADMQTIRGVILEESKQAGPVPLVGATIYCIGTNHISTTDSEGAFSLQCALPTQVAVSYVGYKPDTLNVNSTDDLKIILKPSSAANLNEVTVTGKNPTTYISSLSTLNTLNIGSMELTKAACCNLSESFETSPSVDVTYSDAVTGIKQIQLLGLSGNYTQITTENTPEIRGLAGSYGLTFIPGPWIEGIQVTKGTGSVVNGFESIAGQINVEELKPDKMDRLFVNAYANEAGRLETTTNLSQVINDNWSTALLLHANGVGTRNDNNDDGFLDIPKGRQLNVINRWQYANTKGVFAQFAIKALSDRRQAGQTDFDAATDKLTTNQYGVGIDVSQYGLSGKLGYIFPQQKYKSIGFIFSAHRYNNSSYYGLTSYNAKQNSVYANLIYQSIIGTTNHKFRTGLSFIDDRYNETYNIENFKRKEIVPGAFFEYTYAASDKFTAIGGLRFDYHNAYGLMTTPRLHLKYDFTPQTNLRFSVGSGFRTANIFAENSGLFASARQYSILNPTSNYGYGLSPEKAWNYGFNFVRKFKLNNRSGAFSFDAYRTSFTNQVVVDVDASPQEINFYNLKGKSFSNSLQAEFNYELIKKLDVRLAYRWLDVRTNYHGTVLEKPLIAKHRAFVNLAYEASKQWKFDLTTQWLSKKRLPYTGSNPSDKQLGLYSPAFVQMSAQVTKQFGDKWDVYVGAENLTNFKQQNPIVSADQPFSPYFDGSMVWGPIYGRMVYVGMRFRIK